MKFCWVTLNVKDMARSLKFYQETVGLGVDRRMKPNPEMEIVFLGSGETKVELIWNAKAGDIAAGKDVSLGFEAGSLDEIVRTLEKNGIAVHAGPFQPNPHIRFLYVLDPDGNRVQFVENIR